MLKAIFIDIPSSIPHMESLLDDVRTHDILSFHTCHEQLMDSLSNSNLTPSEGILLTDSEAGILKAKSIHMTCIAYSDPVCPQHFFGADLVLEGLDGIDFEFLHQIFERSHGIPVTIATTKELILREMTIEDAKALYQIKQDPDITKYMEPNDSSMEEAVEKHRAYINNCYHFYGYGLWGVFLSSTNQLIGQCGIQNTEIDGQIEYELGYLITSDQWHHGYGSLIARKALEYGLGSLGMERIVAVIAKEHIASIQTAKKIGMHFERELFHKGQFCNLYVL